MVDSIDRIDSVIMDITINLDVLETILFNDWIRWAPIDGKIVFVRFHVDDFCLVCRSQNGYVDGYQRNADNDRFSPRNRSYSFNQSSPRFNRNENGSSYPSQRFRDRDSNDMNQSGNRMRNRMTSANSGDQEPGETAWTSADNADTVRSERREKPQGKRARPSNLTDENKPRRDKSNEGTTTTGSSDDADPWGQQTTSRPASSS